MKPDHNLDMSFPPLMQPGDVKLAKPPIQYPEIWTEEWLQIARNDFDNRIMTSEERYAFERILLINTETVYREKRKEERLIAEAISEFKTEAVRKALRRGKLSIEEIAEDNDVPVDYVISLQAELS